MISALVEMFEFLNDVTIMDVRSAIFPWKHDRETATDRHSWSSIPCYRNDPKSIIEFIILRVFCGHQRNHNISLKTDNIKPAVLH